MDHGVYVATSGFLTQEKRLEIIANNLANASTVGYKADVPVFQIVGSPRASGRSDWTGTPWNPIFVGLEENATDFSMGPLRKTDGSLDVSLAGDGFFVIETPQGWRYTRRGDFALDGTGTLITQDGYPVMGRGGRIILPNGEIQIDRGGNVFVDGNQEGQLRVVDFKRKEELVKEGNGRFFSAGNATNRSEVEQPEVRQGFLEMSNVNPVGQMVRMIETIRTYEAQQKVIHAFDGAEKKAVDEVGRLR